MSYKRVFPVLTCAVLLLSAPGTGSAEELKDRKGQAHTWSDKGSGKVGEESASLLSWGKYSLDVKVKGTHAETNVEFGSADSCSASKEVSTQTSYQLSVSGPAGSTYAWSAGGTMKWQGKADVGAAAGYTAKLTAFAGLVYAGDLKLRGAANVAVHTAAEYVSEHTLSLEPGIKITVKRKSAKESDEVSSGGHDSRSGKGPDVRVIVAALAKGSFSGTRATGGSGDGRAQATIDGKVSLSVACTPPGGDGGGGPSTPGGEPQGPTTKTYRIEIVPAVEPVPGGLSSRDGGPNEVGGTAWVNEGAGKPDRPKNPTHELDELVGIDEEGNFWEVSYGPNEPE